MEAYLRKQKPAWGREYATAQAGLPFHEDIHKILKSHEVGG